MWLRVGGAPAVDSTGCHAHLATPTSGLVSSPPTGDVLLHLRISVETRAPPLQDGTRDSQQVTLENCVDEIRGAALGSQILPEL